MICPRCGKRLIGREEWVPSEGFTGNIVYSHIHNLVDVLTSSACTYVYTEHRKDMEKRTPL